MAMPGTAHATCENIVDLSSVRAERLPPPLPVSLEMDWEKFHAAEEPWSLGRTIWFAVVVSTALWAVIAGAVWLV
jgi:hypothetical protein